MYQKKVAFVAAVVILGATIGSSVPDRPSFAPHPPSLATDDSLSGDSLAVTFRPDSSGPSYVLRPRTVVVRKRENYEDLYVVGLSDVVLVDSAGRTLQHLYPSDTLWYGRGGLLHGGDSWAWTRDYTFDGYRDISITVNHAAARIPQYEEHQYFRWRPTETRLEPIGIHDSFRRLPAEEALVSRWVHRANYLYQRSRWFIPQADSLLMVQFEKQGEIGYATSSKTVDELGLAKSERPLYIRRIYHRKRTDGERPTRLVHAELLVGREEPNPGPGADTRTVIRDTVVLYHADGARLIDEDRSR